MADETDGDVVVAFDYEGERYRLANDEMTAAERLAWRQTFGMPYLAMLTQGLDIDFAAGVIWIIKRRSNPRLRFSDIAEKLTWKDTRLVINGRPVDEDDQDNTEEVDEADPTESVGS